jgi:hypothetical protein
LVFRLGAEQNWSCTETSTNTREVSNAMSIVERVRQRRQANRRNRAIDQAWQAAPTQAMRDEIRILAQRQHF